MRRIAPPSRLRTLLLAVASLGVALVAAVPAPSSAAAGRDTLPSNIMGFSLGPFAQRQESLGVELRRIVRVGANTATVTVWWEASDDRSIVTPAPYTKPDPEVALAVRAIRDAGLHAAILPLFQCTTCESNWRGSIRPANKDLFYESYRQMIERYADIAESEGASLLFIGSEMSSLQGDTDEWRAIAEAARDRYSGAIAYDVNWDAIDGVHFWDEVDIPSVSAYFPLSDERHPTLEELKKAWYSSEVTVGNWYGKNAVAEVHKLANRTGKPVLFGEAGYRSRDWGTKLPFDYTSDDGGPNLELQADAYQALIETFHDKPWWRGVLWWEWDLTARPEREKTFTPRDKPAENVLRAWYAEGLRPTAQRPRLAEPQPAGATTNGKSSSPSGGSSDGEQGATGGRRRTQSGQVRPGSRGGQASDPNRAQEANGGQGPVEVARGEQAAPAELGTDGRRSTVSATTMAALAAGALLVLVAFGALGRRGP